jgi:hypothetical protein
VAPTDVSRRRIIPSAAEGEATISRFVPIASVHAAVLHQGRAIGRRRGRGRSLGRIAKTFFGRFRTATRSVMSNPTHEQTFFRAMRDFAIVHLPLYPRVFAIFLIFASPALSTIYFYPTLDHFNKAMYHVPSFALLALAAIIFYRLRWYIYTSTKNRGVDQICWSQPGILASSAESQSCWFLSALFFLQGLYEQAARASTLTAWRAS